MVSAETAVVDRPQRRTADQPWGHVAMIGPFRPAGLRWQTLGRILWWLAVAGDGAVVGDDVAGLLS